MFTFIMSFHCFIDILSVDTLSVDTSLLNALKSTISFQIRSRHIYNLEISKTALPKFLPAKRPRRPSPALSIPSVTLIWGL